MSRIPQQRNIYQLALLLGGPQGGTVQQVQGTHLVSIAERAPVALYPGDEMASESFKTVRYRWERYVSEYQRMRFFGVCETLNKEQAERLMVEANRWADDFHFVGRGLGNPDERLFAGAKAMLAVLAKYEEAGEISGLFGHDPEFMAAWEKMKGK